MHTIITTTKLADTTPTTITRYNKKQLVKHWTNESVSQFVAYNPHTAKHSWRDKTTRQ